MVILSLLIEAKESICLRIQRIPSTLNLTFSLILTLTLFFITSKELINNKKHINIKGACNTDDIYQIEEL